MKIYSLIVVFVFLCLNTVFAHGEEEYYIEQKEDEVEINKTDEEGRKQGLWIYFGKDQPEKGYPEEGKISEGPFVDDRKNGHWIIYHIDGKTPKTEGNFINNRPHGQYVKYHSNGIVKEVGTFNKRFYIDSLKRFNELGILVYEGIYDSLGKEFGTVKYFYDNGELEFEYQAKNGYPTEKATRYWPNGDVKEVITYGVEGQVLETTGEIEPVSAIVEENVKIKKPVRLPPKPKTGSDFKPNGYNKVFNDDRELWMEGEFKNGLLFDGRLYVYDEDGLLFKVEIYKDGHYHSDGQL